MRISSCLSILAVATAAIGGLTAQPASAAPVTFSNTTPIAVPASGTSGEGSPYPSQINVTGVGTTATNVWVTLSGFSHTFPDDVDILLVGPTGSVVLMSDAGSSFDVTNLTLTFRDGAAALPNETALASGTYAPTNYGGAQDTWPAPAPAGPYGATLLPLLTGDVDGWWSLYVADDFVLDAGSISGGWSITFDDAANVPEPATASLLLVGGAFAAFVRRRSTAQARR